MPTMKAMFAPVRGRGKPPAAFLVELVTWLKTAPADLFEPNEDPEDVYLRLHPLLGPLTTPLHRRAAMGELLRCLAGFESSWRWNEGVDKTNARSQANIKAQETGIFQVSFDSLGLDVNKEDPTDDLKKCVLKYCGVLDAKIFIDRIKADHQFAFEYVVRLLRNSFYWDGPIKRREIDSSLSREAMAEIMTFL